MLEKLIPSNEFEKGLACIAGVTGYLHGYWDSSGIINLPQYVHVLMAFAPPSVATVSMAYETCVQPAIIKKARDVSDRFDLGFIANYRGISVSIAHRVKNPVNRIICGGLAGLGFGAAWTNVGYSLGWIQPYLPRLVGGS